MPLGQSVTVVNKSGVIVKNSKQLVGVFNQAKAAYTAKKTEIKSARESGANGQPLRNDFDRLRIDDDEPVRTSSARRRHDPRTTTRSPTERRAPNARRQRSEEVIPRRRRSDDLEPEPRPLVRGLSDSYYNPDHYYPDFAPAKGTTPRYEQDLEDRRMRRRNTDVLPARPAGGRRRSYDDVHYDPEMAYGDLPPNLPVRNNEVQLQGKMTALTRLLEEAHCVRHSATETIAHLQKNPDALAAVALTLAEAAKIARKMAPGALMSIGKLFPAAFALLLSPEFLIAGGLAVGVTVVMLGGYKIIKRLKDKKELEREAESPLQLRELEPELSHIDIWRRGIAEAEYNSIALTTEGEFVTPEASRRLIEEGWIKPEQLKPGVTRKPVLPSRPPTERAYSERSSRRHPSSTTDRTATGSTSRRRPRPSRTSSERSTGSTKVGGSDRLIIKGVKMLFKGKGSVAEDRH